MTQTNVRSTEAAPTVARRNRTWAGPLAAVSLIAAAAHIPVTGEHLEEAPYIGMLFIALEIASVVLAVAVLARPSRAIYLMIAGVGGLAVLALVLSRTIGLPLIGDDIGNWTEPLAVISLIVELIMTIGGLLAAQGVTQNRMHSRFGLAVGGLLLIVGLVATAIAASSESSDDDMGVMSDMSSMHM